VYELQQVQSMDAHTWVAHGRITCSQHVAPFFFNSSYFGKSYVARFEPQMEVYIGVPSEGLP